MWASNIPENLISYTSVPCSIFSLHIYVWLSCL